MAHALVTCCECTEWSSNTTRDSLRDSECALAKYIQWYLGKTNDWECSPCYRNTRLPTNCKNKSIMWDRRREHDIADHRCIRLSSRLSDKSMIAKVLAYTVSLEYNIIFNNDLSCGLLSPNQLLHGELAYCFRLRDLFKARLQAVDGRIWSPRRVSLDNILTVWSAILQFRGCNWVDKSTWICNEMKHSDNFKFSLLWFQLYKNSLDHINLALERLVMNFMTGRLVLAKVMGKPSNTCRQLAG